MNARLKGPIAVRATLPAMRPELAPLAAPDARAGVFLDFDGTLSEIVPVVSDARPLPDARALLERLGATVALVAVVSGRSAHELVEWLGPAVEIWGVHGAEHSIDGRVEFAEELRPHIPLMERVRREARAAVDALGVDGIAVEDKRVVVTLHYRTARDPLVASGVVEGIAEDLAVRHGLVVEPGRASVELRPPVPLSKGAVVRRIVSQHGLTAALFAGDDTGDLPAFQALDELAAEGLRAVKVAVRSEESPPGLLASADLVVDGPRGVLALLDELTEGAA